MVKSYYHLDFQEVIPSTTCFVIHRPRDCFTFVRNDKLETSVRFSRSNPLYHLFRHSPS
jgi:hypothetical protein